MWLCCCCQDITASAKGGLSAIGGLAYSGVKLAGASVTGLLS